MEMKGIVNCDSKGSHLLDMEVTSAIEDMKI